MERWLGFTGQSNAWEYLFGGPVVSDGTQLYRNAAPGTEMSTPPYDWGASDPNGWWAATAAAQTAAGLDDNAMVFWQGEADASAGVSSATHSAALQAAILHYDTLVGHSNTHWVAPKLNITSVYSDPGKAGVRAGLDDAEAAMPTRLRVVNIDDIPTADGAHYSQENYAIIFARCKAALADLSGNPAWA